MQLGHMEGDTLSNSINNMAQIWVSQRNYDNYVNNNNPQGEVCTKPNGPCKLSCLCYQYFLQSGRRSLNK